MSEDIIQAGTEQPVLAAPLKRKGGRPKGSKNRPKAEPSKHGRSFLLGGNPEQTEEANEKAQKAHAKAEDQKSSASERTTEQQLEAALEKIAEYERLHKKWVLGDFSDYEPEHPFELLIQTDDRWNMTEKVPLFVNGKDYSCLRGVPVRVPKFVVDMLNNAKIEAIQKMVTPDGNLQHVTVNQHRYPFTARPLPN